MGVSILDMPPWNVSWVCALQDPNKVYCLSSHWCCEENVVKHFSDTHIPSTFGPTVKYLAINAVFLVFCDKTTIVCFCNCYKINKAKHSWKELWWQNACNSYHFFGREESSEEEKIFLKTLRKSSVLFAKNWIVFFHWRRRRLFLSIVKWRPDFS